MMRLELAGVHYTYPGGVRPALENISCHIDTGEFVILVGRNGCGKSTLARVMAGLIEPASGSVKAQYSNPSAGLQPPPSVGILLQNPDESLFTSSVAREIAWGLENRALPPAEMSRRVGEALAVFGLTELANRPLESLSDGQKQMAALAALVTVEHQFYILDEAAAYLDPYWRRRVSEAARELTARAGVLWITSAPHPEILPADRIWVMHRGKLATDGKAGEILKLGNLSHFLNRTQR